MKRELLGRALGVCVVEGAFVLPIDETSLENNEMKRWTVAAATLLMVCCSGKVSNSGATSNQPATALAVSRTATGVLRLQKESAELEPALAAMRRAVGFKPIGLAYEIQEDGSVSRCELKRIDGEERLASQVPPDLAAQLCGAFSKRRYSQGVKRNGEITFGTPHLN